MTDAHNPLIDPKDFDDYERDLNAFLKGEFDPHRFVAIRLNLGIYAQRQDGMCMVRAKLPGGRVTPRQLLGCAEAAERWSGTGGVHITTRQDIQFHYVPLEKTAEHQRTLGAYGIGSREAGGNTVRNITGCPLAGACSAEQVDVNPYIEKTAQHFVRHPLTASLPRKFKISFSGCASDCANGLVHDLGVIAVRRNGEIGFKLLAGGGLGSKPKEAIVLREFVAEANLLPAIEAVLAVHDKYSDRKRRMRSRIKFLLDKFGEEGFRARFEQEYARILDAFTPAEAPLTKWRQPDARPEDAALALRQVVPQYQKGLAVLPVSVPNGELSVQQLRAIAELMVNEGLNDLRTNQDQNFSLFNVPEQRLNAIIQALDAIGLQPPKYGDRVVSCPGTSTCPLGITASRKVSERLTGGVWDLAIRVNGCQNACANANISDIGLYGKGRRHHGRLIPSYTLQIGGDGTQNGGLALTGPDIPAVRVPTAVKLIHDSYHGGRKNGESFRVWAHREGRGYFDKLLAHLSQVNAMEIPFLARDHGDSRMFQVEAQGIGECAGAQAAPADKRLLDARYEGDLGANFAAKNKHAEAGECLANQLSLSARSLLDAVAADSTMEGFPEVLAALRERFAEHSEQLDQLESLHARLEEFNDNPDELQYPPLGEAVNGWYRWAEGKVKLLQMLPPAAPRSGTHG